MKSLKVKEVNMALIKSSDIPANVRLFDIPEGAIDTPLGEKGIEVKGNWHQSITDFILRENVKALNLNYACGWEGEDLGFLRDLNTIEHLQIISAKSTSVSVIENMKSLRKLNFNTTTKEVLDFSKLINLEHCFLVWWKGAKNLSLCSSLKSLYIEKAKLDDFSQLSSLQELEEITLGNSNIESLHWVEQFKSLKKLELLNCKKLHEFSSLSNCKTLRWLAIDGSKNLSNIDFVSSLNSLEILNISDNGNIESLKPLEKVKSLKALSFGRKTTIDDGDLSVLESLPKLAMLMFAPRRHYSHKLIKPWNWNNIDTPDRLLAKK